MADFFLKTTIQFVAMLPVFWLTQWLIKPIAHQVFVVILTIIFISFTVLIPIFMYFDMHSNLIMNSIAMGILFGFIFGAVFAMKQIAEDKAADSKKKTNIEFKLLKY